MKWFFPKLNGGEEKGLNDPGIENFKRAESLGRETCQNIGDVMDDSGNPAIATFELIHLPADEFPGRKEFIKIFESCRDHVLKGLPDGTGNESRFFERGLEVLNKDTIPVLRIGDENTTGLLGTDDDRTKPFYKLLKLQGASTIQGAGGGTYGIGQRAPFAHSALRTVMYSTKTPEGRVFITKSILASFPDPVTGEMTQNVGWWCNENDEGNRWSTIRDESDIPERFKREKIGTDVWVTGFLRSNWEQSVRHSILQHFFAAIENGQFVLQIMVDGKITIRISKENLEEELIRAAEELRRSVSKADYQKGLGSTLYFYKALKQPYNGKPFEKEIKKIGNVKLYLYRDTKNNDIPDRWATMRMPRIIVEHYGSGLLSNFAAVLLCESKDGNDYLAQLEDPTHEKWNVEYTRNWTEEQKEEAREVLKEIRRFVSETLKAVRGSEMRDEEDIPFLGRYLPAEDDDTGEKSTGAAAELNGKSTEEETGERRSRDNSEPVTGVARTQSKPHVDLEQEGASAGSAGRNKTDGGNQAGKGGSKGKQGGSTQSGEGEENLVLSPRNVRFRSYISGEDYRVILRSGDDLTGDLKICAVGEDSKYAVEITKAIYETSGSELQINGSVISNLKLLSGKQVNLRLSINSDTELCLAMGG